MMFRVEYPAGWFLRGTTATGDEARATLFETEAAARAALTANRKFLKAAMFKAARIVRVSLPAGPVFGEPR